MEKWDESLVGRIVRYQTWGVSDEVLTVVIDGLTEKEHMLRVRPYPTKSGDEKMECWEVALEIDHKRKYGAPLKERGEWYFVEREE